MVLVALLALLGTARLVAQGTGVDFYNYWAAATIAAEQPELDVYAEARARRLGVGLSERLQEHPSQRVRDVAAYRSWVSPSATPLLLMATSPFARGDFERDLATFQLACGAAGLVALVLLTGLLGYPVVLQLAVVVLLGGFFVPTHIDLEAGNVDQLQLLLIASFAATAHRLQPRRADLLGGAVLGGAVLFKLTLVWVPVVWMAQAATRGDLRSLARRSAGLGLGALAAVVVSSAWFGTPGCWVGWLGFATDRFSEPFQLEEGNLGLVAALRRLVGRDLSRVLQAAGALVVGLALIRGARREAPEWSPLGDAVLAAGLGGALWVLGSALAWTHHYVLVVPLFLYLLRPGQLGSPGRIATLIAVGAFLTPTIWRGAVPPWGAGPVVLGLGYAAAVAVALAVACATLGHRAPPPRTRYLHGAAASQAPP